MILERLGYQIARDPFGGIHAIYETGRVKNITVSVDDEVHRRARIKAAERATSVSAVVREFLINRSGEEWS